MILVVAAAIAVAVAAVSLGLHRLALWAEGRGWIYYRNRPRAPVGLGLLAEIYAPEMEHVIEERTSEAARRTADEEGAPPSQVSPHPRSREKTPDLARRPRPR